MYNSWEDNAERNIMRHIALTDAQTTVICRTRVCRQSERSWIDCWREITLLSQDCNLRYECIVVWGGVATRYSRKAPALRQLLKIAGRVLYKRTRQATINYYWHTARIEVILLTSDFREWSTWTENDGNSDTCHIGRHINTLWPSYLHPWSRSVSQSAICYELVPILAKLENFLRRVDRSQCRPYASYTWLLHTNISHHRVRTCL